MHNLQTEPINTEFFQKASSLVSRAVTLIALYIEKGEKIPFETIERTKLVGDSGWRSRFEVAPMYFMALLNHRDEIERLPQYSECLRVMREDPKIAPNLDQVIGTAYGGGMTRNAWDYLYPLIEGQLSPTPEFRMELFKPAYLHLEEFLYADTIQMQLFAPIANFKSDVERIDFREGLTIRRITPSELEELLNEPKPFLDVPQYAIIRLKYAMELVYSAPKVFGFHPGEQPTIRGANPAERLDDLITAMRIYKGGAFWLGLLRTRALNDLPFFAMRTGGGFYSRMFFGPEYVLLKTEVRSFKDFWISFKEKDLKHPLFLQVAVRCFNQAYDRITLEDKLIDFMISFEALFFQEGETGELRHRLSVRVARLLREDYNSRKKIAKEMRKFYDARSKVVHGEKVDLTPNFVETVENYLRESLRLILESLNTTSQAELISKLDLK